MCGYANDAEVGFFIGGDIQPFQAYTPASIDAAAVPGLTNRVTGIRKGGRAALDWRKVDDGGGLF